MDLLLRAWRSSLKTGVYYVRSNPITEPPMSVSPRGTWNNGPVSLPAKSSSTVYVDTLTSPSDA